jgi:hypothetical protein
MSDERIQEALRALAESDRDKQAAPHVEAQLRHAFRRHQARRSWQWGAVAAVVAAAAAGVALLVWNRPNPPRPQPARSDVIVPAPIAVDPAPVIATPERKVVRVRRTQPREVVTEFFPLIDVAPAFERGAVVRVSLPAGALRNAGIPVNEDHLTDRVQADVLVGEEGLARAIRLVKQVQ